MPYQDVIPFVNTMALERKTFIKVLQLHPLLHLLDPDTNIDDVIAEIAIFMGMRYGIQKDTNMSEKR